MASKDIKQECLSDEDNSDLYLDEADVNNSPDLSLKMNSIVQTLAKFFSEHDETTSHYENELNSKESALFRLASVVDQLNYENKLISERYNVEIINLKCLNEAEAEKYKNVTRLVDKLEQQNEVAVCRISSLNTEVAQLQESLKNYQTETENIVKKSNSTKLELDQCKTECWEQKEIVVDLQEQLKGLNEALHDRTALLQAKQSDVDKLKNVIESCQAENERIRKDASDWRDKLKTSETSLQEVRVHLNAAEEAAHKSGYKNNLLEETIQKLHEQMIKLEEDTRAKNKSLTRQNETLSFEVDKLHQDLNNLRSKLETTRAELASKEVFIAELQSLKSEVEEQNRINFTKTGILQTENQRKQEEIVRLSGLLSNSQIEGKVLAQRVEGDHEQLAELNIENSTLQNMMMKQSEELNNVIVEKTLLLDEQRTKMVDLKLTLKEQCEQLESHREAIKEIQWQLKRRSEFFFNEAEEFFSTAEKTVFSYQNVHEDMHESYLELTGQTEQLKRSLWTTIEHYEHQIQDQRAFLLDKVDRMQAEFDESESKRRKLKADYNFLQSQLREIQEQLNDAHITIAKNEDLIRNQNLEMHTLKSLNDSLSAELFEQKSLNEELKNKVICLLKKTNKLALEKVYLKQDIEEVEHILLVKEELIEEQQTTMTELNARCEEIYTHLIEQRKTTRQLRQRLDLVCEENIFLKLAAEILTCSNELRTSEVNNNLVIDESSAVSECRANDADEIPPTVSTLCTVNERFLKSGGDEGAREDNPTRSEVFDPDRATVGRTHSHTTRESPSTLHLVATSLQKVTKRFLDIGGVALCGSVGYVFGALATDNLIDGGYLSIGTLFGFAEEPDTYYF